MKANELMVGDWYAFRGHPYKCTASDIASIAECEEKGAPTDISEIPITAEILEKNGFRECVWSGQNAWSRDYLIFNSVTICIDGRDGGLKHFGYLGYQSMIVIDYVHQLQHALRLCGIEKEITL